ncbi:MAG TPA: hypothetical protein VFP68_12380, partial [Burkholderiaceae bacterium]|nr:hypothetical protein [Burkholderiaceae bacterium]
MRLKAEGKGTDEISKRLDRPHSLVRLWLQSTAWSRGTLAPRLARLADYAALRDEIHQAAVQLELHGGELPAAATKRASNVTTGQVAAALEELLGPDLPKDPKRRISHVAGRLGIPRRTLRAWINERGTLLRPGSVQILPDFEQHRRRLVDCLTQLGQMESVLALSSDQVGIRQHMMAESLVAVLGDLAREPLARLEDVVLARNINVSNLRQYLAADGALVASPDKLVSLPDYGQHVKALKSALTALGHQEDADRLRPPAMAAGKFLDFTRRHFGQLMAAVERLSLQPDLDQAVEARRAGVPPILLTVLLNEAGKLRTAEEMVERLFGLKDYQRSSVNDMLARIVARHAKGTREAQKEVMKRIDLAGAGHLPDRVLIVGSGSVDPESRASRRIERIYANSRDLVREPRSYAGDRPRQVLRWLSTMLMRRFPAGKEVQCYYDAPRHVIVVSANSQAVCNDIRRYLRDGGIERLLNEDPAAQKDMAAREMRHFTKLARRMDPASNFGDEGSEPIFAAIAERRFEVPKRHFTFQRVTIDLHAERRIKEHLRSQGSGAVDLAVLAGTKRPCGTCASELDMPAEGHRGPFWLSVAGRYDVDVEKVVRDDLQNGVGSSVTRARE